MSCKYFHFKRFKTFSFFQMSRLSVTLYGGWTKELTAIQHIIFTVSGERFTSDMQLCIDTFLGVCFFFNSTLNPILYSVMSLREGFKIY